MMSPVNRYKRHHQAACTELDGEIAIFQSNTCDYLVLNETGSAIWNALESRPTLAEICRHLQEEYAVTEVECAVSVKAWLDDAISKQVVTVIDH